MRLSALLLLTACASDRVKVDGLDPFDVRSEVWASEPDAHGLAQTIVLTNVADYCDKARAAYDATVTKDAFEADDATFCRDTKEVTQAWATAMSELSFPGAHYLTLQPEGDGGAEDVAVGDWGGDSTASALTATLTYIDQDYYGTYLEDWDEDAEEIDRCGVKSGNELGAVPARDLEEGLMTISAVSAGGSATGEMEGSFAALEGEDAAVGVTAKFDAAWCEVGG